jgi:hypothetical protein
MAVYETSVSSRGPAVGPGWGRETVTNGVLISLPTTAIDNANDDVGVFYVPDGAVIVGAMVSGSDMDSGTALVVDLGDALDEDRLISAATVLQTGTLTQALAATGHLYKYATRTQLRVYINTAGGTPVAGTIKVSVSYFCDPEFMTAGLTIS